jgi:chloramphenicol 3-O-phosphotransferase
MILWINGAFGAGKTSVANELCRILPKAYLYDPELAGYFLWDVFPGEMKRKGNFQHIPIWREMNRKILKHISGGYDGVIIAPQTVYIKQYYDEIIGRLLEDNIAVKHFILTASKHTIINRIAKRPEGERAWAREHIDKCQAAFETAITGTKIDTENKSVAETAIEISKHLNLLAG